jgi:hypothetical protein
MIRVIRVQLRYDRKSPDYKYVAWVIQQKMNNTHSQTNSRRITTPVSGFLLGKCHAAPIMPCMIGVALFLPSTFVFLILKHC